MCMKESPCPEIPEEVVDDGDGHDPNGEDPQVLLHQEVQDPAVLLLLRSLRHLGKSDVCCSYSWLSCCRQSSFTYARMPCQAVARLEEEGDTRTYTTDASLSSSSSVEPAIFDLLLHSSNYTQEKRGRKETGENRRDI